MGTEGVAYWEAFDRPKIIYPEITWRPQWSFDTRGLYINNTVYILSTDDLWILAVMNSPIMWWYAWRNATHGKDEALRFIREFVQELPISKPNEQYRKVVHPAVCRLIEIADWQSKERNAFHDWLRVEFAVEKPSQKLQDVAALDSGVLVDEVKKARGKKKPLSVADLKRLREEHGRSIVPLQTLAAEARAGTAGRRAGQRGVWVDTGGSGLDVEDGAPADAGGKCDPLIGKPVLGDSDRASKPRTHGVHFALRSRI